MKISPKTIFITITAVAVLSAIFVLSCTKNEPPVVIGAALSLSGSGSYVGEEVRDGMALAADEINSRGGINGRKVEIVVKNALMPDGKISDESAKSTFEELEKANPLIIVSSLSFVSMKLATIAEEKKRLLVGLVATVPELTHNRDWVYRYWTTAEHEAPPMADIFLEIEAESKSMSKGSSENQNGNNNGDGVLGVIYMDDAYGGSVFKDIEKRGKDKNISIKPSAFPSDTKDFTAYVDALKESDAVVIIGFDFHIINILKALRSSNYKGEIISTTTATLPSVTSTPESDGVHVTAPALYNKNYPFADQVKGRYEAKFGKPFTQYSANGYDFVYILMGLLEDKKMNQETVKAIFDKGFVYSGVFGNIELKKGSKDILFPLFPAKIKNGEVIYR
ncbi:MAG: ABC transporter substrate-binding protein [Desulfamplus sp.]|nr:ABC transporter substrate-binding protein [Desulfamplus sp.]